MKREVRNVAASKRERLANRARSRGDPFDLVVRRFFFERFLYRLSISPVSDRFVLKGRRARFGMDSIRPAGILPLLVDFLVPLLESLAQGDAFDAQWKAAGRWSH